TAELTKFNETLRAEIAERQWAESEMRQSEARKAGILKATLDAIITLESRGMILEFNPAAERLFGRNSAEMLGQDAAEVLFPPTLRERFRKALTYALATGDDPVVAPQTEQTALHADGSEFPIELALKTLRLEGRSLFIVYIHDLRKRKRLEEKFRQSQK